MAAQYGSKWSGCVICSLIDNDNAKCWIQTRTADNRDVRYLLQILAVLEFKFKFRLISYYVNTKMNFLADYIGRGIVMERSDRIERIQKELIDVFVPGMQYREMDSLMSFFTSGQSALACCVLPGDGPGSLASVLGHISVSESAPEVECDVGDGFGESGEVLLGAFGLIEARARIHRGVKRPRDINARTVRRLNRDGIADY